MFLGLSLRIAETQQNTRHYEGIGLAAVRRNTNQCQSAHTRGRCTMNAGMIKQQGAILYLVLPTYTEQKLIP